MKLLKERVTDVVVHVVYEDSQDETVKALKEKGLFDAAADSHYAMLDKKGHGTIYYGIGKEEDNDPYQATLYFHNLGKYLQDLRISKIHLEVPASFKEDKEFPGKTLEGLYQAEYCFDRYKTEKEHTVELQLSMDDYDYWQPTFDLVEKVVKAAFHARDLVNQRPLDLYPETLAEQVQEIFQDTAVEVEIYDEDQIEEMGMEAFLQVAKGSDRPPRFIVLKYMPTDEKDHLTLVGKGMTYDSGGYAIKPGNSMKTMHSDMAGAAAVIGGIYALATVGIKQNVAGVIAAAENLIDGKAFKNGDIISSMKGTTIEVNNTDAEGRLTLADAIYYAATELNSKAIVDLATLTGAAITAVGPRCTALMSNDGELAEQILTASRNAAEPTQRLQAFPSHYKQIKGKFGDLDNAPEGGAGAITAGVFLEHFTEEIPWAHLDIAGPSYSKSAYDYLPQGASGTGVKTIYRWIAAL